ncbi:MAG: hypothetical protein ACREPM_02550, partial [Gemmatimonadaceae bacterium]
MADVTAAADLRPLEDSYRIVGELRVSDGTQRFMATRVQGGAPVMISVFASPIASDDPDNNELSHFAADAKQLAALHHPTILQVLDGRWVGDRFALVTERTSGRTLQDELDRHTEFRNPRIAMVLQDIWSAIEIAREQGVVHRWVTPDSVYFDPNSKRVVVVLSPAPIPMTGVPGAAADARTIGTLAWAMLTGAHFEPAKANAKLAELAPNLATRVVDVVNQLIHTEGKDAAAPDVPTALGIIAAGDVLKQGEIEIQAMKEEYEERHRQELEKCENHRVEVEQYAAEQASIIADERASLERLATEQSDALASERVEIERFMKSREERMVSLRLDLERQAARAARGVDVEAATERDIAVTPPAARSTRRYGVAAAAALVLVIALVAWLLHERAPGVPASGRVSVGKTTIVPAPPSLDTTHVTRGGFLSQSAGGSV